MPPPPNLLGQGDATYAQKGFLWVRTQEIMPGPDESWSSQELSLRDPSWLKCESAPRGVSQGRSGAGKESR